MITRLTRRQRLLVLLLCSLLLLKFNSKWASAANQGAGGATLAHTLTGDIRFQKAFQSKFLPFPHDLIVYLPPDYEQGAHHRYPVLYMQDGQNLFDGATSFFPGRERHFDEIAQTLISERSIRPLIIVGVYSNALNRVDEYTPTRSSANNRGGQADLYGRMLIEEIKPFIDSHYRTLPDRSNTALGGWSLGGLLTLYLGLKHADTFGELAVTSPAGFWDNEMIVRCVNSLRQKTNQRIWLSVGTGEPDEFVSSARDLDAALIAKGWKPGNDLVYTERIGAQHYPGAAPASSVALFKFLFAAKPPKRAASARSASANYLQETP